MTRVSLDLHHNTATATLEDKVAVLASKLGVSEHLVRRLVDKLKQGSTRGTPVNRNVNGVNYTTSYRIHDPTFSRGVTHTKGPLAGWRSHTIEADAERGYEALVKQNLDLDDEERTIARELWAAIEANVPTRRRPAKSNDELDFTARKDPGLLRNLSHFRQSPLLLALRMRPPMMPPRSQPP